MATGVFPTGEPGRRRATFMYGPLANWSFAFPLSQEPTGSNNVRGAGGLRCTR